MSKQVSKQVTEGVIELASMQSQAGKKFQLCWLSKEKSSKF